MSFCQFVQAHAAGTVSQDRFAIDLKRCTADPPAFQSGAPHTGTDTLDDQVALELGDGTDDDHDRSAEWTAGVNVLSEADELDAEMVQLVEYFEIVTDRTGDAIAGPDHDDIELAAAGVGQQLIESWTPGLRAADFVRVFVDDLEAALLGELAQVIELGFGMLIDGTDSEVKRRSLHQRRPFRSCGRCFCT